MISYLRGDPLDRGIWEQNSKTNIWIQYENQNREHRKVLNKELQTMYRTPNAAGEDGKGM